MKLVGLSMVRDEADIIESFVRHNLGYVDELHVIVQPSQDATRAILDALVREGLPLRVTDDDEGGFMQGRKLTALGRRLLRSAAADAVLVLDADEFVRAPDKAFLADVLARVPDDCLGSWQWISYVPTVEAAPSGVPVTRVITARRRAEYPIPKIILTRCFAERSDLLLPTGSHEVHSTTGAQRFRVARIRGAGLAHFPVRSASQIRNKIERGLAAMDKDSAGAQLGFHWRRIREMIEAEGMTFDLLQKIALDYQFTDATPIADIASWLVDDPLPCNFALRYDAR
ncbi:MAG TPA: glycosyltransferase family 2 protein [Rhodocyclaceae bacterium]|nr:glycosyltransferase family 2 protein [Rhodocyclaceae bacterium]HNA04479.1 glycosyltransferase family 2 protein [Rhodocyclaceae bacterium]